MTNFFHYHYYYPYWIEILDCLDCLVWILCNSLKLKYTEEYEQSQGKGSFPAMITPGYQAAKQANTLASSVCWLFHSCIFLNYENITTDSFLSFNMCL